MAEAYSKGLVNSPAFPDSHTAGGSQGAVTVCVPQASVPPNLETLVGRVKYLAARNSNILYLKKLEEALGNNETDILATCHVAQLQEPRRANQLPQEEAEPESHWPWSLTQKPG